MNLKYNPEIHNRRSIRLKNYDYSQNGAYFVTICTKNRECWLENNVVKKMINKWWNELSQKFSNVELDEFVVMPNHIHFIIFIVGADLRVCPNQKQGEHTGSPLHKIVQWFKTMTTNEYMKNVKHSGWKSFNGKLWQRNYYEHVIRDDDELNRIREYTMNNPLQWELDENNPKNIIN